MRVAACRLPSVACCCARAEQQVRPALRALTTFHRHCPLRRFCPAIVIEHGSRVAHTAILDPVRPRTGCRPDRDGARGWLRRGPACRRAADRRCRRSLGLTVTDGGRPKAICSSGGLCNSAECAENPISDSAMAGSTTSWTVCSIRSKDVKDPRRGRQPERPSADLGAGERHRLRYVVRLAQTQDIRLRSGGEKHPHDGRHLIALCSSVCPMILILSSGGLRE